MKDFFQNIKNWVKLDQVRTDNNVFKLHYKFTVILLLSFFVLLSSKQYFGNPIECEGVESVDRTVVNVFCWISGTFTLLESDAYEIEANLRGIKNQRSISRNDLTKVNMLLYYQWIFLLFILQAMLFYLPRYLWKIWENNELKELVKDLRGPLVAEKWSSPFNTNLIGYLLKGEGHNVKALRFAFCELLNLVNVILQIFIMDWYLNKRFLTYGIDIFSTTWSGHMDTVFPRRAVCFYTNYGAGGGIQNQYALCVLPLNVLNEKFFLILWFWCVFLTLVSFGSLVYRFLFLTSSSFRVYLLLAQVKRFNRKHLIYIGKKLTFGQTFLVYNIGKNVSPIIYKEFLEGILERLCEKV